MSIQKVGTEVRGVIKYIIDSENVIISKLIGEKVLALYSIQNNLFSLFITESQKLAS